MAALKSAVSALLTKAGQSLAWAVSPQAAAALSTISAEGRIAVGPSGGVIFDVPAYITEGLEPGQLALVAASDIAADVTAIRIATSHAAAIQYPDGGRVSLFQANLIGVKAVIDFGFEPLAENVMATVTIPGA